MTQDEFKDLAARASEFIGQLAAISDMALWEQKRIEALGRKGFLTAGLRALGDLPPPQRAALGQTLNRIKEEITAALAQQRQKLLSQEMARDMAAQLSAQKKDITLPVLPGPVMRGRCHPIWQVMDEACAIFARMGFAFEEGPDIETEYYNFTALNIPEDHPARQSHDTFFFAPDENGQRDCLRTHTSPVQIRVMEHSAPPYRFIAPGRVYRCDSDQTHTPMFHQIEGVAIDRDIHLGHLKWVLLYFLRNFFENDAIEIRLRPHYFPFTEPSLEVDMRADPKSPWLEICGCGMVHPHVLEACDIDPDQWQGFAFGFGVDRLAMLKYGIKDLRSFFGNDRDWLAHYGFTPFSGAE